MFPYRKILELHGEKVSLRGIAMITQHSRQKVTEFQLILNEPYESTYHPRLLFLICPSTFFKLQLIYFS